MGFKGSEVRIFSSRPGIYPKEKGNLKNQVPFFIFRSTLVKGSFLVLLDKFCVLSCRAHFNSWVYWRGVNRGKGSMIEFICGIVKEKICRQVNKHRLSEKHGVSFFLLHQVMA